MIEVKHLTKRYGSHTAVSDLNFSIENGKIYGFLGPNGAGKSTTMNTFRKSYEIGGKQLPAALYTYKHQEYLIDLLRLLDSTGKQTVAYTAKYNTHGGKTIEALDTAIRNYRTE